ncbi:MAG: sensor domain-containing protein [Candidatus Marinimicrobia bacterium]|nr:sensor domain-containing protein [Candidatus Neomarinimicrobiota bacterium]MCF7828601.1 sensor domain-containing protein [Candidatus Neomarinimicrobiota bacterium]MCF7880342.1 sensor domain-containing protein [Candidatus Neomarinimicrobiota bacterium]
MSRFNSIGGYFNVLGEGRTYLNLMYLILSFPLGLVYFVMLTVGISLGIGLLIIWIGIAILAGVLAAAWAATIFERYLTESLLGIRIHREPPAPSRQSSPWERIRSHLTNPETWKGLLFLGLKFPLGIASFVISITLVSIAGGLLAAPFTYNSLDYQFSGWELNSMNEAMLLFLLGIIISPLFLHILNIIATAYGTIAKSLLGTAPVPERRREEPEA